ncbi:MAG: DUF2236 domain-containing protein [Chitinophagaceae bacterium]|nr:DUF2236 domain-containing protein [Chitinophagaceae bacterium]
MEWFVREGSIVRKIWGKADTVLFIFAGAAGEFALNKAVDWLYFTGKLPADPIGRLFSTVVYARKIIFAPLDKANTTIDHIRGIHTAVEGARGRQIPDWAYRDVLYMLIHYSIASFELLDRKLSHAEKEEVYDVFYRFGRRMQLKELPVGYEEWLKSYDQHLKNDLTRSDHTTDLFRQYRKHLGAVRYYILLEAQKKLMPAPVKQLLGFGKSPLMELAVPVYKAVAFLRMDKLIHFILLPSAYRKQIAALNIPH